MSLNLFYEGLWCVHMNVHFLKSPTIVNPFIYFLILSADYSIRLQKTGEKKQFDPVTLLMNTILSFLTHKQIVILAFQYNHFSLYYVTKSVVWLVVYFHDTYLYQ